MSETLPVPVSLGFDFKGQTAAVLPERVSQRLRAIITPDDRAAVSQWRPVTPECQPAPHHRWRAGAVLRMRLISWHNPTIAACSDEIAATALVGNPSFQCQLDSATAKAASVLGLEGPEIVLARMDRLALEAASVEMLREHLLEPAKRMVRFLAAPRSLDCETHALLRQTGFLLISVLTELAARLREADAVTDDILQALADAETSAGLMRATCFRLVRRYPGLVGILAGWADLEGEAAFASALADTHAFLVASSVRQTAQPTEEHHDRLDQIRPLRKPGQGIAAACRSQQRRSA